MSDRNRNAISYRSKADGAYLELRGRILEGTVAPASLLNQEQLATDLGVSTTPLREALRRLESEGLVLMSPHKDVQVAPLDPDEMRELYDVREVLDAMAVRLAAAYHDEGDRERMEQAKQQLLTAGRAEQIAANRAFHAAIYRACHNDVLIALLDALWDRSDRFRRAIASFVAERDVVESHLELLERVVARDADGASAEMAAHIRLAKQALEEAVVAQGPSAAGGEQR